MKTQEAQVIMLPTNQETSPLGKFVDTNKLIYRTGITIPFGESQHLYFISDEPIKRWEKNIWCINKNRDTLYKLDSANQTDNNYWDKVIATTNPDLWYLPPPEPFTSYIKVPVVPKIDTTFIEAYVREQGKIDIVLLEGIYVMPQANGTRTDGKIIDEISLDPIHNTLFVPKLKPNGSVIVYPVKEKMYSKEEVKQAIIKFAGLNPLLRGIQVLEHNVNEFIEQHF